MVGVFVAFIRVVYGRMIYMSLPGSRPRADWLLALTTSYRNLPFLAVASWNPEKKTAVIWSSCEMKNKQYYLKQ